MGGHGHHDEGNLHNMQESDSDIVKKIRPIELIKHNPNLFHLEPLQPDTWWTVLGGTKWAATATTGTCFGYWYYNRKLALNPATYYVKLMLRFSRMSLGFAVGSFIGYLRYGDRQHLHNAWVAERLRRRYAESKELETHDLWKFKGERAKQEYYRWT